MAKSNYLIKIDQLCIKDYQRLYESVYSMKMFFIFWENGKQIRILSPGIKPTYYSLQLWINKVLAYKKNQNPNSR